MSNQKISQTKKMSKSSEKNVHVCVSSISKNMSLLLPLPFLQ